MLVQHIKKFITALHSANKSSYDTEIYTALNDYFRIKDDCVALTHDDRDFLLSQFRIRSSLIKYTDDDYTLSADGVNAHWTQLAKDLASDENIDYIKILFSDVVNTVDFISKIELKDTINTDSLYWGDGHRTLYRKRDLCRHLLDNGLLLSTYRSADKKELSPLSVEELTRLNRCKRSIKSQFSVNNEAFSSFWDFLQKKVFPKLNKSNNIPLDLIPYLVLLIQRYHVLKTTGQSFELFIKEWNAFLGFLYKSELKYVNQFYGVHFENNGRTYYPLDFLIILCKAQTFTIDDDLSVLHSWLVSLYPVFTDKKPSLSAISLAKPVTSLTNDELLYSCKLLLVSLFVWDFRGYPWEKRTISVLDKTNNVVPQVAALLSRFQNSMDNDEIDALPSIFKEVMKDTIEPYDGSSLMTCLFATSISPNCWFEHAKAGTFSTQGLYWYDPKLLIHTLVCFRAMDARVSCAVNVFLDALINTYCQNVSELNRQIRVNILFFELVKEIKESTDLKALLLSLELRGTEVYHSHFLTNCAYHVGNRLHEIDVINPMTSTGFFSCFRKMERVRLEVTELVNVGDVIKKYKKNIHQPTLKLKAEHLEQLMRYLQRLSAPIVTHSEAVEAERSVQVGDPFGAPT
jgi:hypothetical protein